MEINENKKSRPSLTKSLDTRYKMIIPAEVEAKIKYICKNIWDTEWSGILFYSYSGNFEDKSLTIRCKDIFIMDIGTEGSTEFDMTPDVISYMTDNDLLDYQVGLIHSHHSMSTFFSGVDTNTLLEEGIDRAHFVSLIVNNKGSYTAGITRRVTATYNIKEVLSYPTFGNKEVDSSKDYTEDGEKVEWFELDITIEGEPQEKDLDDRIKSIKDSKKDKKYSYNWGGNQNSIKNSNWNIKQPSLFDYDNSNKNSSALSNKSLSKLDNKKNNKFNKEELDEDLQLAYDIGFDKDVIKSLTFQLITGSIVLPKESKLDVDKWMKTMESIFDKRFGNTDEGFDDFKEWANGYIEFICYNAKDKNLEDSGLLEDEIASVCANSLMDSLVELPSNKYINEYIDILSTFII